jgi:cell division protein FtsL
MASWATAAAHVEPPLPASRRRARVIAHRPANVLRSGVTWIILLATLLAGVVALNVAVLQLNVRLDKLSHERAQLRADNDALQSELSSSNAAPRIQSLARTRLGLVPPPPDTTTFVTLAR